MNSRTLSLAAAAVLFARIAAAQQADTTRLAPLVTTATRVPVSALASPSAVTVITPAQMQALGITHVSQALEQVPGAMLNRVGSFGGATSLFLRGGESKYVKVLIDGVPVNDPGGAYDFSALTTDNLERIEILRGPASVLYGADAVTGVVQLFTKRGAGAPSMTASARAGTYGSSDVDASVAGTAGSADYTIGMGRHQSSGLYDFNNDYRNTTVSGLLRIAPDSLTTVRASLRYTDQNYHYPTNGSGVASDSNNFNASDRTAVGLQATRRVTSSLELQLDANAVLTDGGTTEAKGQGSTTDYRSQDRLRRRSVELRGNVTLAPSQLLTLGASVEQQDQQSQSQGDFGGFISNSVFGAARRNRAVFGQLLSHVSERVTTTLGARLDDNQQFGTFGTWRAAASARVAAGLHVRASAGTAFREPSFLENYSTSFTRGNPDLAPEQSRSIEVGVSQELLQGRATIGVSRFVQRFRNMIDYQGSSAACGASYCNIARASADGTELEASLRASTSLSVSGSYTRLDTRVTNPGFDNTSAGLYRRNEQLIRRPRNSGTLLVSLTPATRAHVEARALFVGSRTDKDFAPFPAVPVVVAGYTRIDLGADLALTRKAALTLAIENLNDARYETVYGFRTPRRMILAGLRLQ
ncbi:MAG: TonB-dependent receptor [Gemmatimonadetes bacterium]|nr:TonB-dependent receptor [Gemmatimonadota bacterium]